MSYSPSAVFKERGGLGQINNNLIRLGIQTSKTTFRNGQWGVKRKGLQSVTVMEAGARVLAEAMQSDNVVAVFELTPEA